METCIFNPLVFFNYYYYYYLENQIGLLRLEILILNEFDFINNKKVGSCFPHVEKSNGKRINLQLEAGKVFISIYKNCYIEKP